MSNPRIGAHKSIAKSIDLAIDRAVESTCECLQIFSRPPRRWLAGKSLATTIIELFIQKSNEANFYDTAIHMPYLPNIASPNEELFGRSIKVLIEEIITSRKLKVPYIITHLGSPKDKDESFAAKRVAKALDAANDHIQKSSDVMILLENSTAKRKPWGTRLENFEKIFTFIHDESNIGICFDTAHAFSAGYDIREPEGLNETIDRIEDLVGKNRIKMIHINDSKGDLGSGIDHHEHIGQGYIGINCFRELVQNPRFFNIPMILETPKENINSDKMNLDLLRKLRSKKK
ncbi:MAG: deoxyribonuclease IV [Candidatus Hodarchaeales archaeon]|jgi:deoxyribonuclease-4